MRFMVLLKASANSEAGVMPGIELFEAMGRFNQELADAGVLLAGEGLQASSKGARVYFDADARRVERGPFPETEQLIAGFWLLRTDSLEECIDWMKRCPNPHPGEAAQVEIRQVFEAEDFGDAFPTDLRDAEERLRLQLRAEQEQDLA